MKKCEICGKKYKTYPIILSNNAVSIACFVAENKKADGSFRTICEECRNKL